MIRSQPGDLNQPDAQVRLVGGDFTAIEAGLLGTKEPQAAIQSEAEQSTVEYKMPNARAPLISGDFAAIEAGLLGAPREQATATVSETDMSNAFPSMDLLLAQYYIVPASVLASSAQANPVRSTGALAWRLAYPIAGALEHDPRKWKPVSRKDHAKSKTLKHDAMQSDRIML